MQYVQFIHTINNIQHTIYDLQYTIYNIKNNSSQFSLRSNARSSFLTMFLKTFNVYLYPWCCWSISTIKMALSIWWNVYRNYKVCGHKVWSWQCQGRSLRISFVGCWCSAETFTIQCIRYGVGHASELGNSWSWAVMGNDLFAAVARNKTNMAIGNTSVWQSGDSCSSDTVICVDFRKLASFRDHFHHIAWHVYANGLVFVPNWNCEIGRYSSGVEKMLDTSDLIWICRTEDMHMHHHFCQYCRASSLFLWMVYC